MEKDRILGSDISSSSRFSRKFIIISATLLLLIVVVVTAVLLGVFIGGKNATELYKVITKDKDGNPEEQTVQVNPQENIATFYIQNGNVSSTTLLDYGKNLVVMRTNDPGECYVRKLGAEDIPSLSKLRDSLKNLNGQTVQEKDNPEASSFVPGPEIFDRSLFGRSSGLLCQDVRTFWLVKGNPTTRGWWSKIRDTAIKVVSIINCISIIFG
ncbi:gastrokine-2-like [Lethenteron reissneri]|uniref:gastrokine-2-like n=1 Tax=Lethenteron reissneri TaxID=7753 RepID=UPI002AB6BC76|nr:gastrokine-2-like [Lethenteron reissneri]